MKSGLERQLEQLFELLNQRLLLAQSSLAQCAMTKPSWQKPFTLSSALADLWYQTGQDGRSTRNYYGMVQLDSDQLQLALAINQAKTELHQSILALKQHYPKQSKWPELLRQRLPCVNGPLANVGLARLHLKQLLRLMPIVEQPLAKVQLSWYSSGRSIKKLSYQQALAMVEALADDRPQKARYLQQLAALPPGTPLARVQNQAPLLRANLFYLDGSREARNLSLPLAVVHQPINGIAFRYPESASAPERTRAKRSDLRISEEAYIEELRLHLYLN